MPVKIPLSAIGVVLLSAWALSACAVALTATPAPVSPSNTPQTLNTAKPTATAMVFETTASPLESGAGLEPELADERAATCTGGEENLVARGIIVTYDVTYEQVMTWYCGGSEFEDILLALETHEAVDVTVDDLLDRHAHGQTWDTIWKQTGMVP